MEALVTNADSARLVQETMDAEVSAETLHDAHSLTLSYDTHAHQEKAVAAGHAVAEIPSKEAKTRSRGKPSAKAEGKAQAKPKAKPRGKANTELSDTDSVGKVVVTWTNKLSALRKDRSPTVPVFSVYLPLVHHIFESEDAALYARELQINKVHRTADLVEALKEGNEKAKQMGEELEAAMLAAVPCASQYVVAEQYCAK